VNFCSTKSKSRLILRQQKIALVRLPELRSMRFLRDKKYFASREENINILSSPTVADVSFVKETKYRFTFSKLGRARFLSHLELSAALVRALRRSSIELAYSVGYHPHPKISFATATSVGMESRQEYMDINAQEYSADFDSLKKESILICPQVLKFWISENFHKEKRLSLK